ncbi:MAG: hypothetical protein R2838_10410 [Caldilineaceae bacterium]
MGNVEIQLTHDDQLTLQPATQVTLNQDNWNLTDGNDVSNRVCMRAVDDAVDGPSANQCKNRTVNADGGGDSGRLWRRGQLRGPHGGDVRRPRLQARTRPSPATPCATWTTARPRSTCWWVTTTRRIIIQEAAGVTVVDGAIRAAATPLPWRRSRGTTSPCA